MNSHLARRVSRAIAALVFVVGLSGCATTASNPKDPLEGFNRVMFSVNEGIDTVVKPVAQGYDQVTPDPVKAGIGNFFGNIADLWIAVNNFLQGKPLAGFSDIGRVLVNSTVGVVGLFDVASEMGLEKHSEDFGQTLGVWGVGSGPYLYWPVLGSRNVRDTFGFVVDSSADPVGHLDHVPTRNVLMGVRLIDLRASLLPADKIVEQAAFDKYNYIRDAYFQNRRSAIHDGNPPPLED